MHPFAKNKLVVIYQAPGTGITDSTPVKPEKDFGTYIMYQGTAFPHKNLPKLIEAFDILHEQYPKLNLVLSGPENEHYELLKAETKRHPSSKNVIFAGFLPDPQSKWTFQHAKLFVTPTLIEGAGLNPLEAMANGTPVASSNASVMPEYYGSGAVYFDPKKPEEIAATISKILGDEKLRSQLASAAQKWVKRYSWDKFAQENLAVYKTLLKD